MGKTPEETIAEKDVEIGLLKDEKTVLQAKNETLVSEKIVLQEEKTVYEAEKAVLEKTIAEKDSELIQLRAEKKFRDDQKTAALSKAKERVVCGKLQRARPKPPEIVIEPEEEVL